MKILKRKDILSKTITVRVSPQVKAEFDQLRERADAAGFDMPVGNAVLVVPKSREIVGESE